MQLLRLILVRMKIVTILMRQRLTSLDIQHGLIFLQIACAIDRRIPQTLQRPTPTKEDHKA